MGEVIENELDDVFGLVADRTRLEILRALWDERTGRDDYDSRVSFSALRERVGVEDSGRFNYHLDELVPQFVSHEEDGYALTHAGTQIIGAAVSGIYTETDTSFEPTPAGECPSPSCDGRIEIAYESGVVDFGCDTCDEQYRIQAPPILVAAHDLQENPEIGWMYSLNVIQKTTRGFCHLCSGPTETDLELSEQVDDTDIVSVDHHCQECGSVATTSALLEVLDHPAVVSALHEAGLDYREVFFEANNTVLDSTQQIVQHDPVRIEVGVETTTLELTLLLDENLEIIESSRNYVE
jgi:DNA-binding transcriptional ArsR family regulator